MKKIRTIIVDDEPLARARIRKLLEQIEYVTVVGEGKNGRDARRLMSDYAPDLAFLDIQMPDFNGFEVLQNKDEEDLPFIIFVTAYDQYALRAFDVHAVDYLLKPFDDERFMQALEQARKQIHLNENALLHQKMVRLLDAHRHRHTEELTAFEIKEKGKTILVNINDVHWLEAEGNYLCIHLSAQHYLIRQTLQELEKQLNPQIFLRIHRSTIVNTNYVSKVKYEGNNQYRFHLKNGDSVLSSRSYKSTVVDYIEDQDLKDNA
ncbi:MAG: LytTR family DNA-binding domain-containing protein [Saprospiraceae bacterium]|nr:LytTR family DNA-binding domain-containing protein [Saprospiraceae bacterium]